jgi:hypothetical protein
MVLGYMLTAIMYFVVASLQAVAAESRIPAVYTILIRCVTNWSLTIVHLQSFDFSGMALINWSPSANQQRVSERSEYNASNNVDFAESVQTLSFPSELQSFSTSVYSLVTHLPEMTAIQSSQVTLECVSHELGWNPQMAPALYWAFVHVPVILLIAVLVSLCAFFFERARSRSPKVSPMDDPQAPDADDPQVPDAVESPCSQKLIYGLFRPDSSLAEVIVQTEPVLFVVLFGLWPQITIRNLTAFSCLVAPSEDGVMEHRLQANPDIKCFDAFHLSLMFVSLAGCFAWSVAPLLYLYYRIRREGPSKYRPRFAARFGYFFSGLEPRTWWWELIVKRSDILIFNVIAYADVGFPDERARLLWFAFMSGMMLAVHERFKPYDERQGGLVDIIESLALCTRFATYLFACALLLLEGGAWLCWILGLSTLIANLVFLAYCLVQISVDVSMTMYSKIINFQAQVGRQSVRHRFAGFLLCVIGFVMKVKAYEMEYVVRMEWLGPRRGVKFVSPMKEVRAKSRFARSLFMLSDSVQQSVFCQELTNFCNFQIRLGAEHVSSYQVDLFMLLALSHREVQATARVSEQLAWLEAAQRILAESKYTPLPSEEFVQLNQTLWQLAHGVLPLVAALEALLLEIATPRGLN